MSGTALDDLQWQELCTSLVGQRIEIRDNTSWIPAEVLEYNPGHGYRPHRVQLPNRQDWANLYIMLFRFEDSNVIYRRGKPIQPPTNIDWWTQQQPTPPPSNLLETHSTLLNDTWMSKVHPVLRMILYGTHSSTSALRKFRGMGPSLIRMIWNMHILNRANWASYDYDSILTLPSAGIFPYCDTDTRPIRITMMPIELGTDTSLPDEIVSVQLSHLLSTVHTSILSKSPNTKRQIVYLSIHQYHSYHPTANIIDWTENKSDTMDESESHHTPNTFTNITPIRILADGRDAGRVSFHKTMSDSFEGFIQEAEGFNHGDTLRPIFKGGVYLASNRNDAIQVWPSRLMDDAVAVKTKDGLHLMPQHIPSTSKGCMLPEKRLHWIPGNTPYQLVQPHFNDDDEDDGWYQYVCVVATPITAWYADRYTANPLGILPDVPIIQSSD